MVFVIMIYPAFLYCASIRAFSSSIAACTDVADSPLVVLVYVVFAADGFVLENPHEFELLTVKRFVTMPV